MKKLNVVLAGAFVAGLVIVSSVTPAYAAKEALWEESFDSMEEGEETGFGPLGGREANFEVQDKIANGGKGKALKISPKEGVDYASNYNLFGAVKDMTYPNENAIITFSYYASGIASLGVMTNDRTIPENCDGPVTGLVQNKWTKVVLRVSKFKVKSPKGTIKTGDEFRYVSFLCSVNTAKPLTEQFVVLDDIKLTIGEDEKGAAEKKK